LKSCPDNYYSLNKNNKSEITCVKQCPIGYVSFKNQFNNNSKYFILKFFNKFTPNEVITKLNVNMKCLSLKIHSCFNSLAIGNKCS